jgi:TRAP-type C4-dicarboxylate transport system substrate-binding protein
MSRIRNIAIVFMAIIGFSVSAAFAAPTVIKLAHPNVPQHPMGQAFEKFKELVEQRTNGEFRVDIYDSSKFGCSSTCFRWAPLPPPTSLLFPMIF